MKIQHVLIIPAAALALSGCGSDNKTVKPIVITPPVAMTIISGKVYDSDYIVNAKVSLDLNGDMVGGDDEPNTTTDENGAYELEVPTSTLRSPSSALNFNKVIAELKAQESYRKARPSQEIKPFTLVSHAGHYDISIFTTLINSILSKNESVTEPPSQREAHRKLQNMMHIINDTGSNQAPANTSQPMSDEEKFTLTTDNYIIQSKNDTLTAEDIKKFNHIKNHARLISDMMSHNYASLSPIALEQEIATKEILNLIADKMLKAISTTREEVLHFERLGGDFDPQHRYLSEKLLTAATIPTANILSRVKLLNYQQARVKADLAGQMSNEGLYAVSSEIKPTGELALHNEEHAFDVATTATASRKLSWDFDSNGFSELSVPEQLGYLELYKGDFVRGLNVLQVKSMNDDQSMTVNLAQYPEITATLSATEIPLSAMATSVLLDSYPELNGWAKIADPTTVFDEGDKAFVIKFKKDKDFFILPDTKDCLPASQYKGICNSVYMLNNGTIQTSPVTTFNEMMSATPSGGDLMTLSGPIMSKSNGEIMMLEMLPENTANIYKIHTKHVPTAVTTAASSNTAPAFDEAAIAIIETMLQPTATLLGQAKWKTETVDEQSMIFIERPAHLSVTPIAGVARKSFGNFFAVSGNAVRSGYRFESQQPFRSTKIHLNKSAQASILSQSKYEAIPAAAAAVKQASLKQCTDADSKSIDKLFSDFYIAFKGCKNSQIQPISESTLIGNAFTELDNEGNPNRAFKFTSETDLFGGKHGQYTQYTDGVPVVRRLSWSLIESLGMMRLSWFENEIVNGVTISKEHGTAIAILDYKDNRYSVLEFFADDTITETLNAETGPISSHIWTLKETPTQD